MFAGNWVPEIVEIAGANDSFGLKGEHSSWSEYESLFDKNPDKIVFMPCGYDIKKTKLEIKSYMQTKSGGNSKLLRRGMRILQMGANFLTALGQDYLIV